MSRFDNLTTEEKEQLKQYISSIKEIKKSINEILKKAGYELNNEDETGGNRSSGLYMPIEKKNL